MKKIALFGASGKTGQAFLKKVLASGVYQVKALARTPSKIPQKSEALEIIKGDVLNPADVHKTIEGSELVVSLFGQVKGSDEKLQTKGSKHIVEAMKAHRVSRVISLSGGGLPFPEKDQPKFADKAIRFIMKIAVPKILNDAIAHAEVLQQSGLEWVIVRAPRLTQGKEQGNYRVGWVGVNASTKISRPDLADFILQLLKDKQYDQQMPFVSY